MVELNYQQIDDLLQTKADMTIEMYKKYNAIKDKFVIQGEFRGRYSMTSSILVKWMPYAVYELYAPNANAEITVMLRFALAPYDDDFSKAISERNYKWHCDVIPLSREQGDRLGNLLEQIPDIPKSDSFLDIFPEPAEYFGYLIQTTKHTTQHDWSIWTPFPRELWEEQKRVEAVMRELVDFSEAISGNKGERCRRAGGYRHVSISSPPEGSNEPILEGSYVNDSWKKFSEQWQSRFSARHFSRWHCLLDYFPSLLLLTTMPSLLAEFTSIKIDLLPFLEHWQSRLHEISALRHLADFITSKSERIRAGNYPQTLLDWLEKEEIESALITGIQQHQQRFFLSEFEAALKLLQALKSA